MSYVENPRCEYLTFLAFKTLPLAASKFTNYWIKRDAIRRSFIRSSAFLLPYSSILKLSLYIPLSFVNSSHLRKNSQECGSSFYLYIYINFRVYQMSSVFWFWSLERIFHEKSPNSRRWRGETSAMMGSAETRNCVSKLFVRCLHLKNLHSHVCGTSLLSALALHKMNNSLRCWREIGP